MHTMRREALVIGIICMFLVEQKTSKKSGIPSTVQSGRKSGNTVETNHNFGNLCRLVSLSRHNSSEYAVYSTASQPTHKTHDRA